MTQQFAATNTPQQIGVSERVRRTLCAMVRCMLIGSRLPPFLWRGVHDSCVVHLQSDSALGTKHENAVQEALREGRRSLSSQDHRRKGLRTHRKPKQARPHVVGSDGMRLQRDREQLLPHVEPKNASCCGEQERRFHLVVLLLLFFTFSVLGANPEKLLYTVANPARGLLNREKITEEKSGSIPPPHPPHCSFGENN